MEQYDVKILPAAQDDLREIVDHLNRLPSQAALQHYDMFVEKIAGLAFMPERCPMARDAQLRIRGYRFLPVKNYIVFFVIAEKIVQIRRILYGKRQYETLLR
jgi:plasmid stabilization system protein ParE